MTGPDVTHLSPADCVAALRSYPRRFRVAMTDLGEDERPDDLAHRPGPDGRSAVDHAGHVAAAVAMLGQALHQVLVEDGPTLPAAVVDDSARASHAGSDESVEAVLGSLTSACEALASAVEHADTDSWRRRGTVSGDGEVSALDVAKEAVRAGAVGLHAAEAAMKAARR